LARLAKEAFAMNIAIKSDHLAATKALAGRVSMVTGSTSGIGLGIAHALAAAGSAVVLNGFGKPEAVAEAQAQIGRISTSRFLIRRPTCRSRHQSRR
jgi:hypothetical protein